MKEEVTVEQWDGKWKHREYCDTIEGAKKVAKQLSDQEYGIFLVRHVIDNDLIKLVYYKYGEHEGTYNFQDRT